MDDDELDAARDVQDDAGEDNAGEDDAHSATEPVIASAASSDSVTPSLRHSVTSTSTPVTSPSHPITSPSHSVPSAQGFRRPRQRFKRRSTA
jgi:hypothetical protein